MTSIVPRSRSLFFPDIRQEDVSSVKASLLLFDSIARLDLKLTSHGNDLAHPDLYVLRDSGLLSSIDAVDLTDVAGYSEDDEAIMFSLLSEHGPDYCRLLLPLLQTFDKSNFVRNLFAFSEVDQESRLTVDAFVEKINEYKPGMLDSQHAALLLSSLANLARTAAHQNNLATFSVDPRFAHFVAPLGVNLRKAPSDWNHCSTLTLALPVPTAVDLETVPIERIIKFNETHARARTQFREKVHESLIKVASAEGAEAEDILNDEVKKLRYALEDQQEAYDELQIKSVTSALSVSTPATVASAALLVSNPLVAGVATGVGLTIGAITWWAKRREELRKWRNDHPLNYVGNLQQFIKR